MAASGAGSEMSSAAQPVRLAHASGLRAVARELDEMHRDMLRGAGADGGVVRLSVLNLVCACVDIASANLASVAVGRVGESHPLRAIIILAEPDRPTAIEADLSLQCSIDGAGQVCAEQVRLNVAGEPTFHLASLVTPLLVPDTPVFLWLVGTPPVRQAFGSDAIAICERIIIDTGAYDDAADTLGTLAEELRSTADAIAMSDMAWERTTIWRVLLAQSFDGEEMRRYLRTVDRVDIECSGDHVSAQGWLLAGWIASRLQWHEVPPIVAGTRPTADVDDHDLVRVVLHCRHESEVATVSVERHDHALHVAIDIDGGMRAQQTVPYERPDTVDLVSTLLEITDDDVVYRHSLAAAAGLASDNR